MNIGKLEVENLPANLTFFGFWDLVTLLASFLFSEEKQKPNVFLLSLEDL